VFFPVPHTKLAEQYCSDQRILMCVYLFPCWTFQHSCQYPTFKPHRPHVESYSTYLNSILEAWEHIPHKHDLHEAWYTNNIFLYNLLYNLIISVKMESSNTGWVLIGQYSIQVILKHNNNNNISYDSKHLFNS